MNTFEAPKTVVPKPIAAKVQGGTVTLTLEPKSVTVDLGGVRDRDARADAGVHSESQASCRRARAATHASAGPANDDSIGPVLFYRQPAKEWVEALPIGNGRLGGMVFGGVPAERIQLNEDTFWSGGPYDPINPEALSYLPKVRQLIREGRYQEAQDLADQKLMGRPRHLQAYQPLGDLRLVLEGHEHADGLPPRAGPRPRGRPRPLPRRRHHVHARGLLERARPGDRRASDRATARRASGSG